MQSAYSLLQLWVQAVAAAGSFAVDSVRTALFASVSDNRSTQSCPLVFNLVSLL